MPKKLKRSKKKLPTKRIAEAEPTIGAIDRAGAFLIDNWRLLVVAFVILGLIAALVVLWARRVEQRELHASFLLSQGITKLKEADGMSGEDGEKAYSEALEAFEHLVEEYGSTESGKLGIFYSGKCLSRLKRYGDAAQHYERFLSVASKTPLYHSLALRSLGFVYQNQKNYEKALAAFKELAEMEGGFLRGESILALGQLYEEMGQKQEALEAYRDFLKEHPDSTESSRIQRRVAFLENQLR